MPPYYYMAKHRAISKSTERTILVVILLLFAVISLVGITWGLPSRNVDKYLFGEGEPWPGEKIYRLAGAAEKFSPDRGADVDVDPLDKSSGESIPLTATDKDVAKIYLRYRLYTYQPDEMITMMALAGMSPRKLDLDPRLYQYGGLFIYPVGALIGACGLVGLIDVRSDVAYYLDNPDKFGKFYIVARAYAAAWGLAGVLVVYAIGRRLGGSRAGWLAALLFTLMPVVVCMAHEGKPHLPGAVLMLLAVLFAMRHLDRRAAGFSLRGATNADETPLHREDPRGLKPAAHWGRDWWLMCVCCGAAFGTVLSAWPIFVLIPVVAWRDAGFSLRFGQRAAGFSLRGPTDAGEALRAREDPRGLKPAARGRAVSALKGTALDVAVAALIYLITNPYIVINAIINREVLRSNFGNSLAMYEIARISDGFIRVVELTIEGATLPILVLGVVALILALVRKNWSIIPLAVPAVVFFLQFVLIGAGKPAEYGRFGIFTNTALAIGTACLLTQRWTKGLCQNPCETGFPAGQNHQKTSLGIGPKLREIVNWVPASLVVIWVAFCGAGYLRNFYIDTTEDCSRIQMAKTYFFSDKNPSTGRCTAVFAVLADPGPYCFPPTHFSLTDILKYPSREQLDNQPDHPAPVPIIPIDRRPSPQVALIGKPSRPQPHPSLFPQSSKQGESKWRLLKWILERDTPISWANKPFDFGSWPAVEQ